MLDSVHMTSLFENATEGIILTDQTGKILLTNPALETMFGYTGDELLQQSIEILVPQKFQKNHQGL
nr:PAS domain S-box protein [Chitinophagaceae bacterium]